MTHLTPSNHYHALNTMKFTTRDRDNDRLPNHCSIPTHSGRSGGWWHNYCSHIYPNSQYNYIKGIYLNDDWHSFLFMEIKIRQKTCT